MSKTKTFYRTNKELMMAGEFYSRSFLFDVYNNDMLRKKHYNISEKEWETFVFDFENFIEELRIHLMEVISYSCMCEFRHFGRHIYFRTETERRNYIRDFFESIDLEHRYKFTIVKHIPLVDELTPREIRLLKNRHRYNIWSNSYNRSRSVKILKSLFDKSEMCDLMSIISKCFNQYKWETYYGGKKWGMGADGWFLLNDAKSLKRKIVAIDHAYDLQHNTGLLFNKDLRYENIEQEISAYLTRKRYASNFFEILHTPKSGSNQYFKRFDVTCFPRSYRKLLSLGFKMGIV